MESLISQLEAAKTRLEKEVTISISILKIIIIITMIIIITTIIIIIR